MKLDSIEICGHLFNKGLEHFSFPYPFSEISDMRELQKLEGFSQLTSASFDNTNLNDTGLKYLTSAAKSVTNLSLQETEITDLGIKYLALLPHLVHLRLKENAQLTNNCIPSINLLRTLENLQIHETSIGQAGLKALFLPNLKDLLVNYENDPTYFSTLEALSERMPQCTILVKGKAELKGGKILWRNS